MPKYMIVKGFNNLHAMHLPEDVEKSVQTMKYGKKSRIQKIQTETYKKRHV